MRPDERENSLYRSGKRVQINTEEKILLNYLKKLIKPETKKSFALDIGCGSGEIMEILNSYGLISEGIDFSSEAVNLCISKGLSAMHLDLDDGIPKKNNNYDLVWAGDVIEHVFDPQYLIKEIDRILLKDGYLFFSIPNDLHISKRLTTLFGESYQLSYYKKFGIYKHHTFFSLNLLKHFFSLTDLEIVDLYRIIRIPKLNRKFIFKKNFMDILAMGFFGVAKKK